MKKNQIFKYLTLFFITIVAQVMLAMIEGQIEERSANRYHAHSLIENSWTGSQSLFASIITLPYKRAQQIRVFDKELNRYVEKTKWLEEKAFLLPNELSVNSELKHQILSKGIYEAPVYNSKIKISGLISLNKFKALADDPNVKLSENAFLSFGVQDARGITGSPSIRINQKNSLVSPGSKLDFLSLGVSCVCCDQRFI